MRVLILTDIHQELDWAEDIIKKVNPSNAIINGDTLDSRTPYLDRVSSFRHAVAKLVEWKKRGYTIHPGNHDGNYAERFFIKAREIEQGAWSEPKLACSGYNNQNFKEFASELIQNNMNPCSLFESALAVTSEGIVISHAGLHQAHGMTVQDFIDAQNRVTKSEWLDLPDAFAAVGRCRGGHAEVGGLLWRDEEDEPSAFKSHQIFGHTGRPGLASARTTKDGFLHVNLDGGQTTYGILEGNILTIEGMKNGKDVTFNFQEISGLGSVTHSEVRSVSIDFSTAKIAVTK